MNGTKRYEVPFCEVFKNLVGGFEKRGPIEYLEKMSATSLFGIQPHVATPLMLLLLLWMIKLSQGNWSSLYALAKKKNT
jgi:hypothetical protein